MRSSIELFLLYTVSTAGTGIAFELWLLDLGQFGFVWCRVFFSMKYIAMSHHRIYPPNTRTGCLESKICLLALSSANKDQLDVLFTKGYGDHPRS
jgi:hypothetical protein